MTAEIEIKEKLSAMNDGELDGAEAEALLLQILGDPDLQADWERYHFIGNLLNGNSTAPDASGIMARVSERLKDEPAIIAAPRPPTPSTRQPQANNAASARRSSWFLPAMGTALAASLAAAAVVLLPGLTDSEVPQIASNPPAVINLNDIEPVALSEIASQNVKVETVSVSGTRWKNLVKGSPVERKLNGYLVDHGEFGSPMGVGSYATFVSYDEEP